MSMCVYGKLILLRVGLTGAEDPGQSAKAVLAFAKSGAPRDYFSLCLWPMGHLRMSLGGWQYWLLTTLLRWSSASIYRDFMGDHIYTWKLCCERQMTSSLAVPLFDSGGLGDVSKEHPCSSLIFCFLAYYPCSFSLLMLRGPRDWMFCVIFQIWLSYLSPLWAVLTLLYWELFLHLIRLHLFLT